MPDNGDDGMQSLIRLANQPDALHARSFHQGRALSEKLLPHNVAICRVNSIHLAERCNSDREALEAKLIAVEVVH